MWTIISNISTLRKQSTVVLTTHSMEEAEALCTKMGIMVDGEFKCFGSSQHIKNKYGMGFELEIKIKQPSDESIEQLKAKHGIKNELVTQRGLEALLKKLNMLDLKDDLQKGGLGQELHLLLISSGKLYIDELLRWALIESNGKQIISEL